MPIIETTSPSGDPMERELYEELVAELRCPRAHGQPLIEIKQMKRDGLKHVYVIWDKWRECPPETRASIIRDAFAEVRGAEYEKSIAITIAATVPEAGEAGLLPYQVKPYGWWKLTKPESDEVRTALLNEGASTLSETGLPMLRFATMPQAEEAVRKLKLALPKYEWDVVVTVMSPA
jgi:hypothetical protein